ncbi:MAG: sulfatase-like hydrolase/transferase [Akkermansiaceae bacterium]|nr:sulfatase-like hydrolase/transferase [Akkermansiaceae bacterium]
MNDWIGSLGATPRAITPNLDKLAARGVNFSNAHTPGVYCAPARAAIFSGQFASTTGCYRSMDYFTDHPEIEGLPQSFSKAGYTTFGVGKLYHHMPGSIDVRGWDDFHLRKPSQRQEGWSLDNWTEETPFPDSFPASVFNKGKEIKGGLFLEWAALPNEKEEKMADTIRVNWAVDQLGRSTISLSFWHVESTRRTSRTIVRRNTLIYMIAIRSSCRRSRLMIWRIYRNG